MRGPLIRVAALAAALSLVTAASVDAAVTRKDRRKARRATTWIVGQQETDGSWVTFSTVGSTADGILALVAARRGPKAIDKAVAFLQGNESEVDAIGEIAKVTMALVASGADPRNFAGRDLVGEMISQVQPDGRYGTGNAFSQVFDHALVMLALVAAGEAVPDEAAAWLVAAQCEDGGWQFDAPPGLTDNRRCFSGEGDFSTTDTNTTAISVQALMATPGPEAERSPFRFFRRLRDPNRRGWGFDRSFPVTDANSTALVIQAFRAAGRNLPRGAKRALRQLQYGVCSKKGPSFAFTYEDKNGDGTYARNERTGPDLGATLGAVSGMLEKPLPLKYKDVRRAVPRLRCNGS